jgi:hypothetical protein
MGGKDKAVLKIDSKIIYLIIIFFIFAGIGSGKLRWDRAYRPVTKKGSPVCSKGDIYPSYWYLV